MSNAKLEKTSFVKGTGAKFITCIEPLKSEHF